jgi:hypothetical protein
VKLFITVCNFLFLLFLLLPSILGLNILLSNLFWNTPICVLAVRLLHTKRMDIRSKVSHLFHCAIMPFSQTDRENPRTVSLRMVWASSKILIRYQYPTALPSFSILCVQSASHEVSWFYWADIRFQISAEESINNTEDFKSFPRIPHPGALRSNGMQLPPGQFIPIHSMLLPCRLI